MFVQLEKGRQPASKKAFAHMQKKSHGNSNNRLLHRIHSAPLRFYQKSCRESHSSIAFGRYSLLPSNG